ncbi:UNVERIFIED_CONTAM: hypothetical protein RMT77_000177 [Armadillidium vulgare]
MSDKQTSPNIKSYEIITEDLVKETLQNDRGKNAELLSWELKDFTNKGDGFMSVITSILIKFKEYGEMFEKSYVAKLNPLRPNSSLTDLTEGTFYHEITILSNVIEDMNKELETLGLSQIKTTKIYSKNQEKEKEGFISENLRTQGFVLHDRMKGQDLNHALLVVEELGRFHASSLLLEETIAPKTFLETYDNFEEPYLKVNSPSFKPFDVILASQAEGAIKFLKSLPKYEKCVNWLKTNGPSFGKIYLEAFIPNKPFDVLVHGDSWTNNMLFKYDEKNKPIDIRFVDLQCSRKSSPAVDLIYFFDSSLDGDVRSKYFNDLLFAYYQSFSRVLNLAQMTVPFSFKELQNEVEKRKIFGLVTGIFIVQGVLFANEDEIWDFNKLTDDNIEEFIETQKKNAQKIGDREGPFKDRFLSLFDDMLESPVFWVET